MIFLKSHVRARASVVNVLAAVLGALSLAAGLLGCGGAPPPPPVHPVLEARSDKTPVVLVPGLTGVSLRDPETGVVSWGRGWNLLFPRDGGYGEALPIPQAPDDDGFVASGREAGEVLRSVSLLGIRRAIYSPIYRLLEAQGYVLGDLHRPTPDATFFPFAYDWRQDKIANAGKLLRALERLRQVRGEDRLSVVLICQSCGAHLCRWLAKYGGGTLEEAEAGSAALPPTVHVDRLVMVGSSNGGSLRILHELHHGRKYLPLGRKWQPEVLFTYRSLFQDLPAYRPDYFLDGDGKPLDLDLYDPETWRRYGWSVFDPKVRRRVERRPDLFGSEADRFAYLTRQLDRAQRFQKLLKVDAPGFGDTEVHAIQGSSAPTPDRAVVDRKGGADGPDRPWRLVFAGEKALKRRPDLEAKLIAPGDEHATLASQRWLSAQELRALAEEPLYASGGHFELLLDDATERRLLEILAAP